MSKSFKLDDIKASAEKNYANTEIEMNEGDPVLLLNVLQLSEDERKALQETPEGDTETQLESFQRLLKIIAATEAGAERIIVEFGENLAFYAELIRYYNEEAETGEASPSHT